jgi:hypothetical protein
MAARRPRREIPATKGDEVKANPIPATALSQHTIVLGKTRSGKSSKMRLIVEDWLDQSTPVCILEPKGDWWGLKSSATGKSAGYPVVIFGGSHADVPLNPRAGAAVAELIATGNRPSIVDVSKFTVGERTRFFIDFATAFFNHARGIRYLVIDEVHNFAPQGKILDVDAGRMLHIANKLASEGSGRGILLLSASQRPQKVHKDYVTSHETLIACRVIHKLDRDAVKDWIDGCADPEKGKQVIGDLANMDRADAWVWSPEVGFGPKRIHFPMFHTYDSFKPQEGGHAVKLKGWASVDLGEVEANLSRFIEEEKANDPRELKAEIARLKKQMSDPAAVAARQDATPDPQALTAAEERGRSTGYSRGKMDGYADAVGGVQAEFAAVLNALDGAEESFRSVRRVAAQVADWAKRPPRPAPAPIPARTVTVVPRPASPPMPPSRARINGGAGEKLPRAERRILTALAQYPQGRTKNQVAVLAGYAVNGGGFNNAISALRTAGHLTGSGDRIEITDTGFAALGSWEPLPTGAALLQHWLGQLGRAERAALQVLADEWPKAMSKELVAVNAGYEPSGGGFNNALSRLRTLELIEGRGDLKASDDLFGQ